MLLALIAAPWAKIPSDNADGAGMQAHLHGLFESGDLLYDDEYIALRMSPLFWFVTDQGLVSNHWPLGASYLQAPGWLLGRVAGEVLHDGGHVNERAARWDIPQLGLRCSAILVLAGIAALLFRWLEPLVGRTTASLGVAATVLGTPVIYYAAESPERPHLWGFAVVAILVVRWWQAIERAERAPEQARTQLMVPVELAVWAGLATAIRPQLAMLALLVAHERWVATRGLTGIARLRSLALHGALAGAAFMVWPLLNLVMQRWMYGSLRDYQGEVSQHVKAFLLSTHHGALVWCPVLVIGALGLAIGAARRERGAGLLIVLLLAQIWLDAGTREIEPYSVLGTRTWTGGTSFGPRKLLDAMPLLLPGVIWIRRWLLEQATSERRKWERRLTTAVGLSVIPTVSLLAAAWLDPRICSDVLDGARLQNAMTLGFDPSEWTRMWKLRAIDLRVSLTLAGIVALPLALVGVGLWLVRRSAWFGWTWVLILVVGIGANAWLLVLQHRTDAMAEADAEQIEADAERRHWWHEAAVRQIPSHQALLDARLGDV